MCCSTNYMALDREIKCKTHSVNSVKNKINIVQKIDAEFSRNTMFLCNNSNQFLVSVFKTSLGIWQTLMHKKRVRSLYCLAMMIKILKTILSCSGLSTAINTLQNV